MLHLNTFNNVSRFATWWKYFENLPLSPSSGASSLPPLCLATSILPCTQSQTHPLHTSRRTRDRRNRQWHRSFLLNKITFFELKNSPREFAWVSGQTRWYVLLAASVSTKNNVTVVYGKTSCLRFWVGEDWGWNCLHGANFKKWRLHYFPLCCNILTLLSSFSHFKRSTDMSVKVKDVLDALQQMQKSLECSIWYERAEASLCQYASILSYATKWFNSTLSLLCYVFCFSLALNCWRTLTQQNVITSFVGKL